MASPGRHFGDLHDVDQFEQLLRQLFHGGLLEVDDDGDPAEGVVVRRGNGQRDYVEAPAGEQRRDPGQDAGAVLYDYGDGLVAQAPAAGDPGGDPDWRADITAPPFRRRGEGRVDDNVAVGLRRPGPWGTPFPGNRCGNR